MFQLFLQLYNYFLLTLNKTEKKNVFSYVLLIPPFLCFVVAYCITGCSKLSSYSTAQKRLLKFQNTT